VAEGHPGTLRPSRPFTLRPGLARQTIALVDRGTQSGFSLGVLSTISGGVGIVGAGLWALRNAFNSDSEGNYDATGPAVLAVAGVALVVGGIVLIVQNRFSQVTVDGADPLLARSPRARAVSGPTAGNAAILPSSAIDVDAARPRWRDAVLRPGGVAFPLLHLAF
jgi:hypothetical protein